MKGGLHIRPSQDCRRSRIRHGKYKSAGEMFIKNAPSAENREQNQVMINSLWKAMAAPMAAARDLTEEQFNKIIDDLVLVLPEDFVKYNLVDELVNHEALVGKLCTLAQVEDKYYRCLY